MVLDDTGETADVSIASDNTVAQEDDDVDSSKLNKRSTDFKTIDALREDGIIHEKLTNKSQGQGFGNMSANDDTKKKFRLILCVAAAVILVLIGAVYGTIKSVKNRDFVIPGDGEEMEKKIPVSREPEADRVRTVSPSEPHKVYREQTAAPSISSSSPPSTPPTHKPINSYSPTQLPSKSPSLVPSTSPSTGSNAPSLVTPTSDPTRAPIRPPTRTPTSDPTSAPISDPISDPTSDPTKDPTRAQTKNPTRDPTSAPISDPISDPTSDPTSAPISDPISDPTSDPTKDPTRAQTRNPTSEPTRAPVRPPTRTPTSEPTRAPIRPPTRTPTSDPTSAPVIPDSDSILTFCVIADAPYTQRESDELPGQIATQMEGCEFLVHLGDIFVGNTACDIKGYEAIHNIMLQSHAPAFLVPGDNEWNDCFRSNIDIGWNHWTDHFIGFENNWNHNLSVMRQPGYEENFYFIKKRTLVFGLNIVGGRVHDKTEWTTRLRSEYAWVRDIMLLNLVDMNMTDGVILMAHAHPSEDHKEFFNAFSVFLRDELKNEFPVLYLHGDGHNFMYTPNYHDQSNFLRIQHEGGTNEPVLKIKAGPGRGSNGRSSVYDAFQFDRQLELL